MDKLGKGRIKLREMTRPNRIDCVRSTDQMLLDGCITYQEIIKSEFLQSLIPCSSRITLSDDLKF